MTDHEECAQILLKHNVNINLPTHHGSVPLHFAACMADREIFDLILNQCKPQILQDTDRHGNVILLLIVEIDNK